MVGVIAGTVVSPLHQPLLSVVAVVVAVALTAGWSAWVRHDLRSCDVRGARFVRRARLTRTPARALTPYRLDEMVAPPEREDQIRD